VDEIRIHLVDVRSAEVTGYSTCSRSESSWSRPYSAKGIDSGYVPLAAMIFGEKIADWVRDKYFASGLNSPSPTSSSRSCEHAVHLPGRAQRRQRPGGRLRARSSPGSVLR
jgi:hypothetical protein